MIDFQTPRFSGTQVAKACNVPPPSFRTYFARGQFRVIGDADTRERDANGFPNLFSLRDAVGFGVAGRLLATAKIDARTAFDIGVIHFAYTGNLAREPGFVYNLRQFGDTYLVYHPHDKRHQILDERRFRIPSSRSEGSRDICLLVLNDVVLDVFTALDLDRRIAIEGSAPVADPVKDPDAGKLVGE